MDPLWEKIKQSIHERDLDTAKKLLPMYLAANRSSPKTIYEASEFLRKLGDYRSALRLLPMERMWQDTAKLPAAEAKLQVQLARILNALGASQNALRMVDRLRRSDRVKSKVEILGIYISNGRFSDALELAGDTRALPKSEPWHQDWLLHFYRADALCGTGNWDAAIRIVEAIGKISASRLIQAIALGAKGEYLTQAGDPKQALRFLLQAREFFKPGDQTADWGILNQWLGICLVRLGRHAEAERALEASLRVFYRPGVKPEGWMEALLWRDRLRSRPDSMDPFTPRLLAMSKGGSPLLSKHAIAAADQAGTLFSIRGIEKVRKKRHLEWAADTAWDGRSPRLGLDRVDELVSALVYAGKHGIPQYRLYETLWPHELFSFSQHQKRLEQLVIRARRAGYEIAWEDLHLRLKTTSISASGPASRMIRGKSFLDSYERFTGIEVQRYFSISRVTATKLCRNWLESGLVAQIARSIYRVTRP